VAPEVYAGPSLGVLLSAHSESDSGNTRTDTNIKDNMKSADFGLAMGCGLSFKLPVGALLLDFRYTPGFNDVYDPSANNGQALDIKNYAFSFMLGYDFSL
jgi:hypothetical protein